MTDRESYIALNMLEKVGPIRLRQLLGRFDSPQAILKASADQLERVQGIGRDVAAHISHWEEAIDLSAELDRIQQFGCSVLIHDDPGYPPVLKEIYDPPIVLYVQGSLSERDHHGVAVVGSRMTTPYGREAARKLGYQLGQAGVTLISGGARGIDTAAHQGALRAGGRTIVVIGSGLDFIYPSENKSLFEQAGAQGAVVTQFPFGRKADRQTFPIRNRIVAGMSLGTVVVEANQNSGALITAHMAVEYGRLVYAVPGRIDSPRSKGCHQLIKQGAKLCESAADILSEFEYLFPPSHLPEDEGPKPVPGVPLLEDEAKVMELLEGQELHMDELIRLGDFSASRMSVLLLSMEMKQLIRRLPGQVFQRLDQ